MELEFVQIDNEGMLPSSPSSAVECASHRADATHQHTQSCGHIVQEFRGMVPSEPAPGTLEIGALK